MQRLQRSAPPLPSVANRLLGICRGSFGKGAPKLKKRKSLDLGAAECSTGNAQAQSSSQELAQLFQESQQNIMRLNKSRLSALAKVKAAHERIAELEARLERAASGAAAQAVPSQAPARYQSKPEAEPTMSMGHHAPPQSAPPQPTITIGYGTGWDQAYVHFRTQSQDWTTAPGIEMRQGQGELDGSKVVTINGTWVEFVLNNGGSQWDSPDPNSGKKNYIIDAPGTYRLKSGKLQRIA